MPARLLFHDMHGYVFVRDLASWLAERGHDVTFVCCSSVQTPNQRSSSKAAGVRTVEIRLESDFPKYDLARRIGAEFTYGRRVLSSVRDLRPDVVFSSNAPLLSQALLAEGTRRFGSRFVFWVQDLYGPAARQTLAERLPGRLATLGAAPFTALERRLLRRSDHVVAIGRTLAAAAMAAGVPEGAIDVMPNWADPAAIRPQTTNTVWRQEQGLTGAVTFLYAGTLGKKHPHGILLDLSRRLVPGGRAVVVSEGLGREWLEQHRSSTDPLTLVDYQPEDRLPEVLASADVLVLVLGRDASRYSLPSKLYTYACAGRPVLAVVPNDSEVARLVKEIGCGLVVDVDDPAGLAEAACTLAQDRELCRKLGAAGRTWADQMMNPNRIAAQFDDLVSRLTTPNALTVR
jgi:colanic acid biosynthesis glycosyl transferase WcaI